MTLLRWSLGYLRGYRWQVASLAALAFAEVVFRVSLPWPMKVVVDDVLGQEASAGWLWTITGQDPGDRDDMLITIVVAGLLLQAAHQAVLLAHSRLYTQTAHLITRDVRERLFEHMQALGLRHHSRMPVGHSVYHLENDAGCLEQVLLHGVLPFTFSALTLIVMFVVLLWIDSLLAVVSLAVVPFIYLWIRWSEERLRPAAEQSRQLDSRMSARLQESFAAIRLVKSFAREPYEHQRFAGKATAVMEARVALTTRQATFSSVIGALIMVGTSLVVLVGGLLVLRGRLSVGTLLVALAYLGFVYGPLSGLATTPGSLQRALAGCRRIRETLSLPAETSHAGALVPGRLEGWVEFHGVSVAFDDHTVLRDVSFSARPGESIALVGPSGSGKTTLLSLLPRFYEPSSGTITVDHIDIARYQLDALRHQISIVLQEALVLSGTVRHNLRYGRLDATDEEVEAAARQASAHDFIERLPGGYETWLGESGAGLSGGQKQRLSIARAFLKDAPILILDEPTSALDTVSEALVLRAVRRLREGRTTFVIAHRFSTVRHADRIVLLDAGRLVAEGTHESLVAESALYRSLATHFTGAPDGVDEPGT